MFTMTCSVEFEGLKPVKASSLEWKRSLDNYCDTAKIVLPALCRYIDKDKCYSMVPTGLQIKEGQKVKIFAGYDGDNRTQFHGFVNRINAKVPVEIECEGFSYQLKTKMINKSFGNTTVRKVLEYIIAGTDIALSDKMSGEIEFKAYPFKNYTGLQVLDFLKEKYLLSCFFLLDTLYVGWRATYKGDLVKHRLNWNVAKSDDLLFNTYTGATVHIETETRKITGVIKRKKAHRVYVPKPGDVKRIKVVSDKDEDMQAAANDAQLKNNKKGYTGSYTGFLKPHVKIGMTAQIIDDKYKERNGSYLVEGVDGTFGPGGGRIKVSIGFTVSDTGHG